MATYSIKVLKDGRTLTRKQVTKGFVKTEAAVIQAGADQAYVVSDALAQDKAPTKLQTRRVGQDLHVAFGDSSVAAPDLIIEGYFNYPSAPILGTLSDGSNALYDMSQILNLSQSSAASTSPVPMASQDSADAPSALQDPRPYAGFSGLELAGALGLGTLALAGGKSGGGSEITAAQVAQTKISAFASDNTQPIPVPADYTALGVAGVTAVNIGAINSAVKALPATEISGVVKLQTLVDANLKILAEANGTDADATPGSNPTAADYAAIGAAIGGASSGIANLALLNDVLGNKVNTEVDTVAEINALANAVNAVMAGAAGGTAPSAAQLSLLGLTGVNVDNLSAVEAGIAATLDSGSGVDSLSKLQAIINASTSQSAIGSYAASNLNPVPVLSDYTQLGVSGVTASNLVAINSAVDALNTSNVNSVTKVQSVVDTYVRILAEANGTAADTTPASNPTAADYAAIGAAIGGASSGIANLALLNDVLGNKVNTEIDTVAEINALANAVNAVMAGAAGGTAPSAAQLSLLGLTGVNVDNLSAVEAGIAATLDSGSGVDSLSKLQAIINASTSQSAIGSYAASNLNPVPVLSDYTQLGVSGVTAGNLAAINSAVDALNTPDVNSITKVQSVVDTYVRILAEANGTAADATPGINPAASDYARIGASVGLAISNTYALSLLGDIMGGLNSTAVDSISEINGLASVVDRVMNTAAGVNSNLAIGDFSTIGLATSGAGAVTGVNLGAVIDAIANSGGQSPVASLQNLQNLVSAVATIVSYSDSNTQAAPTVATYSNAGLRGVTSANLAAVNAAIDASSPSGVDTKGEMQAIVDANVALPVQANRVAPDATPMENPNAGLYAAGRVNIGSAATDVESLALLNHAISGLNNSSVDSVAEINALATTVDKIMNLTALSTASAIPAGLPTMAELTALGLSTTMANTAAEQAASWQAMMDGTDSGAGVTTILQLQALIDANAR